MPTQIKPLKYVRGIAADGCVAYQEAGTLIPDNLTITDTQTVDLELVADALQANVRISSQPGNQIVVLPDGIHVPTPLITSVQDSATITHSASGSILVSHVRISGCTNNILTARPDGLCVQAPTPPVVGVTDTPTIDLQLSSGIISGSVRLSAQPGNQIQALSDGLFVPQVNVPIQSVQDSNTIDFTLSGTTLTGVVRISACAGNVLTARPDGLCVQVPPPPIVSVQDTNTIDLNIGAGGVLSGQAIIAPIAGNQLTATPQGLFVPPTPAVQYTDCNGNLLPSGRAVVPCPGDPGQVNINGGQTFLGLSGGNPVHGTIPQTNCVPNRVTAQILVADQNGNLFRVPFRNVDTFPVVPPVGFPLTVPNNTVGTPGVGNGISDDILVDSFFIPQSPLCADRFMYIHMYFNIGTAHSSTAIPFSVSDGQVYILRVSNNQELARAEAFVFNSADTPGLGNQVILGVGHRWHTEVDSAIWFVGIVTQGNETFQRRIRHGYATGGNLQNRYTSIGINIAQLLYYYM